MTCNNVFIVNFRMTVLLMNGMAMMSLNGWAGTSDCQICMIFCDILYRSTHDAYVHVLSHLKPNTFPTRRITAQ